MQFNDFIKKIEAKENFSFSRWGDGEWSSLLGTEPATRGNTDGHLYYPDMGEALANVLKSKPEYYLGMQRFAFEETHPKKIQAFIEENNIESIEWHNADIWHHASIKGYFEDFFKAIKLRQVYLVAPSYMENFFIDTLFKKDGRCIHLQVPDQNVWKEKNNIVNTIKDRLETKGWEKDVLVIFCASMPAKIMINDLYNYFGNKHSFIDAGSVFDPYVGRASRSYHKKVIQRLNTQA